MKKLNYADMVGYPWQERVYCTGCGQLYRADYRQERDWSRCPVCTGEAGRPCRNAAELKAAQEGRK